MSTPRILYYATYELSGEYPVFPVYADRSQGEIVATFKTQAKAMTETGRLNVELVAKKAA